jgi:WD40 repeat protein
MKPIFPPRPNPAPGGLGFCLGAAAWLLAGPALGATNDYDAVDTLFNTHCLECHAAKDPEGGLVLENFESLMKGGERGPAIAPGQSAGSLLVKLIEGRGEGKARVMPPGKRKKLAPAEIAVIRGWIDAGAAGPALAQGPRRLVVPKIAPKVEARNPINALASSPEWIAAGRYGEVELRSISDLSKKRSLEGPPGNVNALVFSKQGSELFAAGGQPGLSGEARQWNVADGRLVRAFEGHRDAVYSLALSPDGRVLATGSYDQKIKLWNVEDGKEIRTLSGHNGCVYGLAFRPDGKLLASASADRTVKLWDVASGERRDTLSQSLKEVYAVAFSPEGKRLLAAGGDSRIRVWEISETAAETTNPILESKFAHEGAILNLTFSADGQGLLSAADDRTVKYWAPSELKQRLLLEKQPDWTPALALVAGRVIVGRLDGTLAAYDLETGKQVAGTEARRAGL